jgi:hypothetical protein
VTALLVGDFQVQAGLPPFGTVRWNPPTASAKLGENVGKFMAQCSIDFGWMLD